MQQERSPMSDDWFVLPREERRRLLGIAAAASGRPAALLELDVWIVWCLRILFGAKTGEKLLFKGYASLAKAYRGVSDRLSEDVDLACNMRVIAPDLFHDSPDAEPPGSGRESNMPKEARARLKSWVEETAAPLLAEELAKTEPLGKIRIANRVISLSYPSPTPSSPNVRKAVKLEFSPCESMEQTLPMPVVCDLAEYAEGIALPQATPRVMIAERTFWEKVTAMHEFCKRGSFRGARFARHPYDITQLDAEGFGARAIADRPLVEAVARHQAILYRATDSEGRRLDSLDAVDSGDLQVVPAGEPRMVLEEDYRKMVESGLILGPATPFEEMMETCGRIEKQANGSV